MNQTSTEQELSPSQEEALHEYYIHVITYAHDKELVPMETIDIVMENYINTLNVEDPKKMLHGLKESFLQLQHGDHARWQQVAQDAAKLFEKNKKIERIFRLEIQRRKIPGTQYQ